MGVAMTSDDLESKNSRFGRSTVFTVDLGPRASVWRFIYQYAFHIAALAGNSGAETSAINAKLRDTLARMNRKLLAFEVIKLLTFSSWPPKLIWTKENLCQINVSI